MPDQITKDESFLVQNLADLYIWQRCSSERLYRVYGEAMVSTVLQGKSG
jgi:hypothetical protein